MRRLLSLFLLVTLLAACSGAPDQPAGTPPPNAEQPTAGVTDPSSEEGQVTISFAAWDYERQIYEPLAKKFMDENPGIKVALVPLDDLMNVSEPNADYSPLTMLRRIVSGADTAPAFAAAPETLGSSLLLDLKPQMDADPAFKADDFLPGALEQYAVKGGTWVLPRYLNVQVLSYNKDLFKKAGLPDPKAGWSWTDLLGAAEQLAKKSGSKVDTYGFLDTSGGSLPLIGLLQEQDLDLLKQSPQDIQLDRSEIVDGVKRIRTLVDSGALFRPQYKEGPPTDVTDPSQMIRDGHIAIWGQEYVQIDGPMAAGGPVAPTYDFPVGKVPYPTIFAGYYGGSDGFIISAGTAHPAESWKWIEFLSRQQTSQPGQFGPGSIPARQSLADEAGFWKDVDEQTAAAYKWAIAHPAPLPERTPDYTVFGAISSALEMVLGQDKKDPVKALQEAQKQMEQQIADAQTTPTPTPNTGPVTVATPEPQDAPEGATLVKFSSNAYNPSDLRQLSRAFRDQHPEIFVEIKATEVYTEPPTMQQVAKTNDCFAWYTPPQSDADFSAVLDLQPLFDADASFPQSDFPAAMLAPYQRSGGLFGMPYAATLRTLNYNKTAFEAAGIKTPVYQWKADDFLAAAQALTKGEGDKRQYGFVSIGGVQDMMFFINQFGGQIATGSSRETRPNFTDPKVIEGIRWYLDLAGTHKVMPPLKFSYRRDDQGFEDKSYEIVQSGRAGMWFDQGYGMFGDGGGKPIGGGQPRNFEVGIAPLPIGANGLTGGDIYLRGFHISAQSQQPQACWEWIKFLSGDARNMYGAIPARSSLLKSDAFIKQATPDTIAIAEIYTDALKQASRQPSAGGDPNAFYNFDTYWFFKALSDAIDKKVDLEQGLAEAQKFTTAYMDCMERTPNKPATCANQTDPSYQGWSTEDPPENPGQPGIAVPRG
ncbi:MAG: extracellular solute-binding protein [Kouleothrix sp.]|nr:extracellular solute-binding protein [Kouleothrix sp.]